MLSSYICAVDIGSSKIAAVVAETKGKHFSNIYFESIPSKGVKRGVIVDSIELMGCVGKALKNLKAKSGINIKYVYANISGQDITTKHSRAIIPLAERGNKVITLYDIRRVNEQARILGSSLEEEIIHQIPFGYSIDSAENVVNPLGLYSHRLESDLYLICAKLSSIQSLGRVINQAGFEIRKLFLSGIATSKVVFNPGLRLGLNIFCDIGSDITEILIFKDGVLKDIEILELGGNDMTRELEAQLKITYDLAEDVKRSYGAASDPSHINEEKEILVKKDSSYKPIKHKLVAEIINSKTKSICQEIKEAVGRKTDAGIADNFITAGRTILLEGFLEALENTLGIPVKIGRISDPALAPLINSDLLSGQKYLIYLTCLGMISRLSREEEFMILPANMANRNLLSKAINRFKEVYQEYF
jgi:cell division protein FtsA